MNIFSNIGITELIIILLLALIVVGPERLPEMGRKLGKTLRDLRKAYENLTKDLGPELESLQQTTQELRESVDSVRSIPQDMIQTVVEATDMEDTIENLKGVTNTLDQTSQTISAAGKMVKDPVGAAVNTARNALSPTKPDGETEGEESELAAVEAEASPAPLAEPAEAVKIEGAADTQAAAEAIEEQVEQAETEIEARAVSDASTEQAEAAGVEEAGAEVKAGTATDAPEEQTNE